MIFHVFARVGKLSEPGFGGIFGFTGFYTAWINVCLTGADAGFTSTFTGSSIFVYKFNFGKSLKI